MKSSPAYVGTILCRENGDLFLIKRIDTIWGNAQWNFPGGLAFWVSFLAAYNRQELVKDIEPRQTGSGIVYERPLISKPGQKFVMICQRLLGLAIKKITFQVMH